MTDWLDWLQFGLFFGLLAVVVLGLTYILGTAFFAMLRDFLRWWLGINN